MLWLTFSLYDFDGFLTALKFSFDVFKAFLDLLKTFLFLLKLILEVVCLAIDDLLECVDPFLLAGVRLSVQPKRSFKREKDERVLPGALFLIAPVEAICFVAV